MQLELIAPFLLSFWRANIKLTPASDTWTDTARLQAKVIDVGGNYTSCGNRNREFGGFDPQTGLTPILWNSWQTDGLEPILLPEEELEQKLLVEGIYY